ncbi:urea ABC transporter permease subunit UrtC [Marinobacter mangrovi]|uniref:urea ABC transporter permease subunit UrtC n=1 Tax=Marinobacter mangrovi TaxID=2803918 RepID=UPI00193126EF|nr:urea ABC transporter permease subunit UrtC [Marinobacter mangrovi]
MKASWMDKFGGRGKLIQILIIAVLILGVLPLFSDIFRLNLYGKYLTYAFVAAGLVLCWGYGGILSLGQGIFFGLGGYCMAMFLKLEASSPENTAIQSTPGIPDFMDWNQLTELPWFWQPFHSFTATLILIVAVPALFAFLIGVAMFKRRVGGVYFAIITQAIASIMTILIIGQQGYTGGINGITDLRSLMGWDIQTDFAKYVLYFACCAALILCLLAGQFILNSRYGQLLIAMRDQEDRVRFSGYDVANIKIFVFVAASVISAIGGAFFTLQVGFMSPSFVGTVASIEMVIFCAVGGRLSLIGAAYGAFLVNLAKSSLSESFPQLWVVAMGALFIAVVMLFPRGLAGLVSDYAAPVRNWFASAFKRETVAASGPETRPSAPKPPESKARDDVSMASAQESH